MTDHVAPQEDQLELPAAWEARLLPWRGRRPGAPIPLAGPEALVRHRQRVVAREAKLRAALASPGNAWYAAAAEAYLGGKPDPRGAAAVATLTIDWRGRAGESWLGPEFDCWLREHGLPFAVTAAVERLAVAPVTDGYYGGEAIAKRTVAEYQTEHPEACAHELAHGGIAAVRAVLAAATDEEYAEVVAAVAAHRDSAAKRIAAMLLLPTEEAWVLEACADYGKARHWCSGDLVVMHAASRPEHLAAAGITDIDWHIAEAETLMVLLGSLGADAAGLLLAAEESARHYSGDYTRQLHKALAMLPGDDATARVFARLDRPHVWESAKTAAARFPVRALRTAARLAPDASADVRPWLAALANRVDPALHVHLAEADRVVVAGLLAGSGRVPDADALPQLLVSPPWTRKRPKAKQVAGLEPPSGTRLVWAEGEPEAYPDYSDMRTEREWRELAARREREHRFDSYDTDVLAYAPDAIAAPFAEQWDGDTSSSVPVYHVKRIMARFGLPIADRLVAAIAADPELTLALTPVLSTAAARTAAHRLGRATTRNIAALWFERHGLTAVPHLVPDALGADRERRANAVAALLRLAEAHGDEAVADAAAAHGPEARDAVAALLDYGPLEPRVKAPKPGDWADPLILPQVLMKGGERAVPAAAVPHLITVLALGTPDYDYPGVQVVADACDRASLTRFSRALFERWAAVGGPPKDGWALTQLTHFADDATVWALAGRIRAWPGEGQHKRAVAGLEVLGAIGTEEALRAIQTIADKVGYTALSAEAHRQTDRIADSLGLSRDQLADRLVPDFGLGERDALVFDYGPRRFHVRFDERLGLLVHDDAGKARKSLPKPGAKDDPETAEESYRRYTALKKELRGVATDLVRRVEAAMLTGRDWSAAEFRRCFAEHALTGHLARRLVWLAETGEGRFAFRIAEDGTFSDAEDDAVALPPDARVRVAHPVHLGADLGTWAERFADYEILQPFEQLRRPVMAFTAAELADGRLTRFEGARVEVGRVLGMTARGWERAAPGDGGLQPGVHYELPGGYVAVTLDPGIYVADVSEHPVQTVTRVRLRADHRCDGSASAVPAVTDPVAASEVLAALTRLTA
ncbi:DUF4132 domain-containing protein [Glycomyces sp. NPDC048151]|uniref:DUF4132 domain-containing protein n=1 Tax=Glycomyces sp. NPDC048151 TaxID=3364002 RepID=UPI0037166A5D